MSRLGTDRFELVRQVGEGSSGVVYEARDLHTAHPVAIKLLHLDTRVANERFSREVAVLAELNHPAIVRYVAHGTSEDGRRFLVMEWLAGHSAVQHSRGPWPIEDVLAFARRLASGLAFAGSRGVVHRDIKPANLMLVEGAVNNAKIVDFGLARFASDSPIVTRTGTIIGTPAYMSPEQARGDPHLDTPTDVFSLGSVLYRCLCGHEPFVARQTLAVLAQICFEEPVPIEDRAPYAPKQLASLVEAMMQKEPRSRPSWRAVVEELAAISNQYSSSELARAQATQTRTSLNESIVTSSTAQRARSLPRRGHGADQRILAALLVGATGGLPAEIDAELHALVTRFGARSERLVDGSRIVLPSQQVDAGQQTLIAARCAIGLRQLLAGRAQLVVCTGRAVIGDRQPLGQLFERGAALLANTPAGVVQVDEASASLLESRFELGDHERGGRTLERERSGGEAPRAVLGQATPFVGRDRELQQLQLVFSECVDENVARAVLVTAPAGGGKSRLRYELIERLRAANPNLTLLVGRGDPMRGGTQFGLLSFAIHSWAELSGSDSLEQKQNKLAARIGALVPSPRAQPLVQFIAELIGAPFPDVAASPQLRAARGDHPLMVDHLLACWLEWLEALGQRDPVLLCVEDLHWSDPASLRFIEAALRSSRERALMVLAFARPEVRDAFPQLWAERDLLEIRLPKLGAKACARILHALAGTDGAGSLHAAMIERADGNPFFLEELARWRISDSEAELPETILAIVQSRLDALGEEPKRLIRAASIFGQGFRQVGLRVLLGEDDATFDYAAALALLCDREIILRTGPQTDQEYAFSHALIRDAAYALQQDADRELGHCLAAEWLEHNGGAPALLADHYERGGVRVRAAHWWACAASQAFEAGSLQDALRFGERAITCGVEAEAFAKLAALLAEVHSNREEDAAAATWSERARASGPAGTAAWWRATRVGAIAYARRGAPELDGVAAEMIDQFADELALPEQALAIAYTATECLRLARNDIAERMFALLPRELPDALIGRPEGVLLSARAVRAYQAGNYSEALRFARTALDRQRRAGGARDVCDTLGLCAYFSLELGAYARAEEWIIEQIPLAQRIGSTRDVAYGQLILGAVYLRQARFEPAVPLLIEACKGYGKLGSPAFQVEILAHLIAVYCGCGELSRAHETIARASLLDRTDPTSGAYLLACRSTLARIEGRASDALADAKSAWKIAREHGVQEFGGVVAVSYVESLLATGDRSGARSALEEAEKWLSAQAAKIDDPDLRSCFLDEVPEHRRIRELSESLLPAVSSSDCQE